MDKLKMTIKKLLHPHWAVLTVIAAVSFAALIVIFATGNNNSMPAYAVYTMSAYSLVICILALPDLINNIRQHIRNSRIVRKINSNPLGRKIINDMEFRGRMSIYQGTFINTLYVVFRVAAGIWYASVWFISIAVYYLVLAVLKAYLIINYRKKNEKIELKCYRRIAQMLFLLNIPMGGMIVLMVLTDSGFNYPGYIIYLSALYTFCAFGQAVINLVRYRKIGSLILSASKVLNFISAMMSVLGLQTAMIARFSNDDESFRKMMNAITGGFVWAAVIGIAVYMLIRSASIRKEVQNIE